MTQALKTISKATLASCFKVSLSVLRTLWLKECDWFFMSRATVVLGNLNWD